MSKDKVIKLEQELADANEKVVYLAGRQPKDLIYQNEQLELQLSWVKDKIKKVLELPPISNERLEILKELEKFVKGKSMDDEKLFETLNELVTISNPDRPDFENEPNILARESLWNEATEDIRDKLSQFVIVYTNILVDKGLIEKDFKDVIADRVLSSIHCQVMEDLRKVFNSVEEHNDSNESEGYFDEDDCWHGPMNEDD